MGCQKSQPAEERVDPEAMQKHAEGLALNEALKTEGELSPEKAKDLQERLRKEHRMIPRRPVITMSVESSNQRMSAADIERSYLYREGATKRCYLIALALVPEAKGEFTLDLARTANDKETVVRHYEAKGSVDIDEFESCIVAMAKRWPLPVDAEVKVKFDLDSLPAPTIEELRRENSRYGNVPKPAHEQPATDDPQTENAQPNVDVPNEVKQPAAHVQAQ